jgi:hypothetical protein
MSFNIEYDGLKIAGIFGPKEIPLDTVLPERKAQTIQEEITPEQAEELKKEYEKVQNLHRAQLMNRGERVTPIEDTLFDPIESATGQIVY